MKARRLDAPELRKRFDVRCGCGDSGGVVRARGNLGRWHEGLRGGGHRWRPAGAAARVQNSSRRRQQLTAARKARASKTRARPRHAGGRPLAFIPTAVVQRARELYEHFRRWSRVLEKLAGEGNGVWARNTLIRRVQSADAPASVHNSTAGAAGAGELELLEAASKTGRRSAINYPGSYGLR